MPITARIVAPMMISADVKQPPVINRPIFCLLPDFDKGTPVILDSFRFINLVLCAVGTQTAHAMQMSRVIATMVMI